MRSGARIVAKRFGLAPARGVLEGGAMIKSKSKLTLNTETLRVLTDELHLVHGGIISSDNCPSAGMPCGPKRPQPEPGSCFCPVRVTVGTFSPGGGSLE